MTTITESLKNGNTDLSGLNRPVRIVLIATLFALCLILTYLMVKDTGPRDDWHNYLKSVDPSKPLETLPLLETRVFLMSSWIPAAIVMIAVSVGSSFIVESFSLVNRRHLGFVMILFIVFPPMFFTMVALGIVPQYWHTEDQAVSVVQTWAHDRYGVDLSDDSAIDVLYYSDASVPVGNGTALHDMTPDSETGHHKWILVETTPQKEVPTK